MNNITDVYLLRLCMNTSPSVPWKVTGLRITIVVRKWIWLGNCHAKIWVHFSTTPNKYFTYFNVEKISQKLCILEKKTRYTIHIFFILSHWCFKYSHLENNEWYMVILQCNIDFSPSLLFRPVIKDFPKVTWGEKSLLYFQFHITVHHKRSHVRSQFNNMERGTEAQNSDQYCISTDEYWLVPRAYSICFLRQLGTMGPGMAPPTQDWAFPWQS